MLCKRLIPCLDVKDGRVVKGVRFVELRDAGDPVAAALAYDAQGADELVFLDITASHEGRATMLDVVRRTAEGIYMPLTVGGGIRSLEDIRTLLRAGADKVSLNTAALERPGARLGSRAGLRQPVHRGGDRRESHQRPLGGLHPRRPPPRRARRGGVGARGGEAGRGRDPAHQHGPRRHRRRLRPRADPRGGRGGVGAGHRLGRGRAARAPPRGPGRGPRGRRRSWRRSFTSASTRCRRPSAIWTSAGCR